MHAFALCHADLSMCLVTNLIAQSVMFSISCTGVQYDGVIVMYSGNSQQTLLFSEGGPYVQVALQRWTIERATVDVICGLNTFGAVLCSEPKLYQFPSAEYVQVVSTPAAILCALNVKKRATCLPNAGVAISADLQQLLQSSEFRFICSSRSNFCMFARFCKSTYHI